MVVGRRFRTSLGDLAPLAESIRAVGLIHPPVVNSRLELVAGQRRLEAVKSLGWAEVPVVVTGSLDEALVSLRAEMDENTCRLDMRPTELVELGRRLEELERPAAKDRRDGGLKQNTDDDRSGNFPERSEGRVRDKVGEAVGVSGKTYEKARAVVEAAEADPEAFEEVVREMDRTGKIDPAYRRVKRTLERLADLQSLAEQVTPEFAAAPDVPEWQVANGDSLAELRRITTPARLVFADPPYNEAIDYGSGFDDDRDPAEYVAWTRDWVESAARVLTPDGSLWVLISDPYAAEHALAVKDAGLTIRNWVIWYETFGVNAPTKFNRTKRHLLYAVKDPSRYCFHPEAVSRPSDRQAKYDDPRANPAGKTLDDVWTDIPRLAGTHAERIPSFPTQLPVALLRRVVSCCTDPGDLVIDPFCGSGTTGAAAVGLGRRFLGVERSAEFADLARLRLKGVRREA